MKNENLTIDNICRIVEFIPSPVLIADCEGKIYFFNSEIKKLFGFSEAEFSDINFVTQNIFKDTKNLKIILQKWHEEDKEYIRQNKTEPTIRIFKLFNKSGEELFIEFNFKIYEKYFFIGLKNLTQLKKTKKKLNENVEAYKMIFKNSPLAIFRTTFDGKIIYANQSCRTILGYSEEDEKETSIHNLENDFYENPEDRAIIVKKLLTTKSIVSDVIRAKKKDGSIFFCKITLKPFFDENGKLKYNERIFEDVTEKEKLQTEILDRKNFINDILNNLPFEIWVIDRNENIILQNYISENSLGNQLNKNLSEIIVNKSTLSKIRNENKEVFKGKIINFEEELINKIGEKRTYRKIIIPIKENKIITKILRIYINITEEKNTENKILNAIIKNEEDNKTKFAQELHDGLGPLLSTIKLYVEWLQKPDLRQDKNIIIGKISETLNDAYSTVREISNNLSPHILTNFGLIAALKSFIDRINQTKIIKIDFNNNLIIRLTEISEIIIYRTICELINNTLKYAEANLINIKIELVEKFMTITYQDNGKGFKNLSQISEGSGLLNIKNRLKSINGIMEIDDNLQIGIKIEIYINVV